MRRASLVIPLLLSACTAGPFDLIVSLKTDLQVPQSFVEVELSVTPTGESTPIFDEVIDAEELTGDPVDGVRLADIARVEQGNYILRVALRNVDGIEVLSRDLAVDVRGHLALTVLMSRDCLGVMCPRSDGAPERTECLAGTCVVPGCDPEFAPELCGEPVCSETVACEPSELECVGTICADGVCLYGTDDSACDAGERCDVELGCVPICSPATCDDGNPCTAESCSAGLCEYAEVAGACNDGVFCNGSDTCIDGACDGHEGDPCVAPTECREDLRACGGCRADTDCPGSFSGPFGACSGFDHHCDSTGEESQTVSSFSCESGICTTASMTATRACMRTVEGAACAPGGATCSGDDCVCPGGMTESSCSNGVDDDCDGFIDCGDEECEGLSCGAGGFECDEGCRCPFNNGIIVSGSSTSVGDAAVMHNGTEFAVVYSVDPTGAGTGFDYHLSRVTTTGTLTAGSLPLTTGRTTAQPPNIAWSGTFYGMAWSDTRMGATEIYFRRFEASGGLPGAEVLVDGGGAPGFSASIGWNPTATRFGVVWVSGLIDHDPFFRAYDGLDAPVGAATQITDTLEDARLTETIRVGSRFISAWEESTAGTPRVYASQHEAGVDADGAVRVDDGGANAQRVDIAADVGDVGVTWDDERHGDPEIYFSLVTPTGTTLGANVRVTDEPGSSTDPAILASGTGFAVAWVDDRSGSAQIWFQRLSDGGVPIGTPTRISCAPSGVAAPALASGTGRIGLAWTELGSTSRIRFASIE